MKTTWSNKSAAANRRPAEQSGASEEVARDWRAPVRGRIPAVCLLVLACVACMGEQVTFDGLRDGDRIEVTTSRVTVVSRIQSPDTIAAVQAIVARHDLGWSAPWFGTGIPTLQVNFYRGARLLAGSGWVRTTSPRTLARSS
jgi:hypothetical protein